MPDYFVTWDIDAENVATPVAAARYAFDAMRRPDSTANVFTVIDGAGSAFAVDLSAVADGDACRSCGTFIAEGAGEGESRLCGNCGAGDAPHSATIPVC